MFLSRIEILEAHRMSAIKIVPFNEKCIKPATYLLHLGRRFRCWHEESKTLDVWSSEACHDHLGEVEEKKEITIGRRDFILAESIETLSLARSIGGVICNLSHLARFGIAIHSGAFWVNPGHGCHGPTRLTLELTSSNPAPVKLTAGMPICHIAFYAVQTDCAGGYALQQSVYDGGDPLQGPKLFEELSQFWVDPQSCSYEP